MRKYVSKRKTLILTLACTAAFGVSAFTESKAYAEEPQYFSLEEMVVTASRVETSKVDTPANITVISQEKLAESNYANAAEALAEVPGVNILEAGAKGSSKGQDAIMLNGDKRVLVLIDGRRANISTSGTFSADWLPPIDTIERIEVLKGAGSALYGTDAVGGVINIITKKGSNIGDKVTAKAATGSWHTEQYGVTASGNKDGLGIFVSANKERRGNYSYKDYTSGDVKELLNSGYDTTGAMVKLDKEIGQNNRLTFQVEHTLAEGGSPYGLKKFNTTDSHQRLNNNFAIRYDWNEHEENSGYAQVYRNYHHAYYYTVAGSSSNSNFKEDKNGVVLQQNWELSSSHKLTGGLEYYDIEVNDIMDGNINTANNKAGYLEDRWQIADSWQLNSGIRYDKHSKYGSEVTPNLALNKKFNSDSNAYLSWGKVFNAPTMDQLYKTVPNMAVANPDLKPETGDVVTLGYNTKLSDKTNVSASVFSSKINDAIDWIYLEDGDAFKTAVNIKSEKRRGLELSVDHELNDAVDLYASYTYQQVKQDMDDGKGYIDDPLNKPNVFKAGVKYKENNWLVNLTMKAATGQSEAMYTSNDYFTVDLGAQYNVSDNTKIFAQLNNLNNACYEESGDKRLGRYPMASRNIVVGLEYSF